MLTSSVSFQIFGIVIDSASNNAKMVDDIHLMNWNRFDGKENWVRCFAHILNLISQVSILLLHRPPASS